MAARLGTLVPRIAVVVAAWILGSGTLTFAAEQHLYAHVAAKPQAPAVKPTLVVPDVRGQAFVFAKGILEDDGFAWHVTGAVHGYPTNLVASQSPAAGTRLEDTGAPTIIVSLSKGHYTESGKPEDDSPYVGTPTRLATAINAPTKKPAVAKVPLAPAKVAKAHAKAKVAKTHKAVAKQRVHKTVVKRTRRPAAFHVPGAPKEPLDEISLPARARLLTAWLTPTRRPTAANERHWLYQHAWIVTGAKFGWWHGADALRILIRVDRRVESLWGVGYRSEAVAQHALAAVQARAR
jgi:hypothetical protein